MGYFDDEKNVQEYVEMAEGYDGRELIPVLRTYVPDGATVLELGMGPGKDLELLGQHYAVTGSDSSQVFLDRYRNSHPGADLVFLDAVSIETERRFDCIYSNKVLVHLTREQVAESLQRQAKVLNENGITFHTLWYGDKEEEYSGLRFIYYTEDSFRGLVGDEYEVLECVRYAEMDEGDSMYVVMRKRGGG